MGAGVFSEQPKILNETILKTYIQNLCIALGLLSIFNSPLSIAFAQGLGSGTALVGHWLLNGNINDSTGRHTEALVGANFVWTNGPGNEVVGSNSLSLNPQNQADTWVEVSNAPDLQFSTNDFTISYWVKSSVRTVNYYDAYGIGRWKSGAFPGQNSWTLLLDNGQNNDEANFAIEAGTVLYAARSPNNLTLNVWHHLVGVRRQSMLELYVDDAFVSQQSIPTGTSVNDNSGLDFYIGASANPGYGADALYDNVQIYQGALSNGGAAVGQMAGGQIGSLYANPGQTVAPVEPPSGLVAWWPANGNALDIVGGNNGTLTNGVTYVPGEVGEAFNLNAGSAMILLANNTSLQLQNFTVEAWIKRGSTTVASSDPTALYGSALLFGYGHNGYAFGMGLNGDLLLSLVDVGGVYSSSGVTDTNWHHVAVTTSAGAVVFYIDGAAYPAGNYNPTYQFATAPAIGGRADNLNQNNNDSFLGAIDEMSVYNRPLSGAEIQSIYEAGAAGKYAGNYLSGPPPSLNIARSGSNVTVWWPAPSAGYILQQNTNLAIGVGWTNSGYSISTAGGTNSITLAPLPPALFFRLANP